MAWRWVSRQGKKAQCMGWQEGYSMSRSAKKNMGSKMLIARDP